MPPQDRGGRNETESAPEPERRSISSRDLLAGHREVVINHDGDQYRLRLTSTNKLILTK
jgi:hemin uptake protein HemP